MPGGTKPGPMSPAMVMALQRSIGNRAVSRVLNSDGAGRMAGRGEEDVEDAGLSDRRELLEAAKASPRRPIPPPLRAEAEPFFQTNFSSAGLHDDAVAQRATAAMGAEAMTLGSEIFLAPGAVHRKDLIGHELSHVHENLRGTRETGSDNGDGIPVTDPNQASERMAKADGDALAAGHKTAPSVIARQSRDQHADQAEGQSGSVGAGTASGAVVSVPSPIGPAVVNRSPGSGPVAVQRAGGGKKEPSARQVAKDIDADVRKLWGKTFGGGRQGAAPPSVRERFARSMEDDRTAQTLSHQAFLHYDAAAGIAERQNTKMVDEREIQGMLINNRLLFASNYNETMESFRPYLRGGAADPYRQIVSIHQSDEGRRRALPRPDGQEYVDRVDDADVKTQAMFAGRRGHDDATAAALRKRFGKPVVILDIDMPGSALKSLLTDAGTEGSIYYVIASSEKRLLHAEQKLLLAMHRSGIKPHEVSGAHAIMGRYRGCLCCTAAMMYYRNKLGFATLDFDPNAGFYYKESLDGMVKHHGHIVRDPDYRGYMIELAKSLPSTSALSRMNPPENAYDNHGPEIITGAENASRRPYRTRSNSHMEADFDHAGQAIDFHSFPRVLDVDFSGHGGGARIGKGSDHISSRRRADRIIAPDFHDGIREIWSTGSKEDRRDLVQAWVEDEGASQAELRDVIVNGDTKLEQGVQSAIYRFLHNKTGHAARDQRMRDAGVPTRHRTSNKEGRGESSKSSKKPGKKQMKESSSGWSEIKKALGKEKKSAFYGEWRDWQDGSEYISFSLMPARVWSAIVDQHKQYTASSMASLLHVAERTLRRHLGTAEPEESGHAEKQKAGYDDDLEMQEADYFEGSQAESSSSAAVVWGSATGTETPEYSRTLPLHGSGYYDDVMTGLEDQHGDPYSVPMMSAYGHGPAGEGSSTGTPYPQVQGYTLQVDRIGQVTYVDHESGFVHILDPQTGRMVRIDH